jgi:CBS domain-containing protein
LLRSILWSITKDVRKATVWATSVSHAIAWFFIVCGLAMAFGVSVPFFGTGITSGIWLALIGWFLSSAATQSRARVLLEDALSGAMVSRIMRGPGPQVTAATLVGDLVREGFMRTDARAFPVVDGDRFLGLVCLEDVRKLSQDRWDTTPVLAIMTPVEKLSVVSSSTEASEALQRMAVRDVNQLPVIDDGRLVGMLYRSDFIRWLELRGPRPAYSH